VSCVISSLCLERPAGSFVVGVADSDVYGVVVQRQATLSGQARHDRMGC